MTRRDESNGGGWSWIEKARRRASKEKLRAIMLISRRGMTPAENSKREQKEGSKREEGKATRSLGCLRRVSQLQSVLSSKSGRSTASSVKTRRRHIKQTIKSNEGQKLDR